MCLTLPVYVTVIYRLSVFSPLSILQSFSLIICQAICNTIKSVSPELSTGLVEVGFRNWRLSFTDFQPVSGDQM